MSSANGAWLAVEEVGLIAVERIVALGLASSAPIKRLVQAAAPENVVVLTGGRRRETVILLDSGHVIVTSLSMAELIGLLENKNNYLEARDEQLE